MAYLKYPRLLEMTYFEPKTNQNIANQRISDIIVEVQQNPGIHHNALRKIVVDEKKRMAKKTFDKLTRILRNNKTLTIVSQNDNKIHYVVTVPTTNTIDFEKEFEPYVKSMESKFPPLKKEYKLFPIYGKQTIMISILSNIFSALTGIAFMNSIGNSSSEDLSEHEIRLRKCVRSHMDIMMHDKDRNVVVPVVQNAILQGFSIIQFLELLKLSQTSQS